MGNSVDSKKSTRIFKHLHSIWSSSLRSNKDDRRVTRRDESSFMNLQKNVSPARDITFSPMVLSESETSLSVCQSPVSRINLTRENSLSMESHHETEEESYAGTRTDEDSDHEDSIKCEIKSDNMMHNGNESQNTLLCEFSCQLKTKMAMQQATKKRDMTSFSNNGTERNKLRRTHSMFANTNEVTVDSSHVPNYDSYLELCELPVHFEEQSSDSLPRISVDTLVAILNDEYKEFYRDIFVIDCRFKYEYLGGHIKNAINISKQRDLEEEFIQKRHVRCFDKDRPPLIVFHCEFSSYRGPIMASHLRTCDRIINHDAYPKLHFPDIVVLDGGFKSFYEKYPERCEGKYVCMESKNHEIELSMFKRDSKKLMTRANSTQFFQLKNQIDKCPLDVDDVEGFYSRPNDSPRKRDSQRRLDTPAFDEECDDTPFSTFSISVPPKLSLGRYGGSPGNRSNSSKSSSLSSSSKLLFSDELVSGFKPNFLEHEESDLDSDAYSFQFGDETEGKVSTLSTRKKLLPELLNAHK